MSIKSLTAATLVLAAPFAFATPALAGDCPSGQEMTNALAGAPTMPKDVTDTVIGAIDLGSEIGVKGRQLRTRRLVVQPGGIVPWHSHEGRPALIYVVSGEIYEHASNCAVPILHKSGEVARETHATAHWWKNESTAPVVLLSFDIQHDPNDHNM